MRKSTKKSNPIERDEDGLARFKSGEEFDALSAEEKEKIWKYYDRVIPESELRDPTPDESATIARPRRHNRSQPDSATTI